MSTATRPPVEEIVHFFESRFFNRVDRVSIFAPWNKVAAVQPTGSLRELLLAHVLGERASKARVAYQTARASGALTGHFRVGSYCPAPDGTTRWLCIDFDGHGHAHALADPLAVAQQAQRTFEQHGLPAYLECSGGGKGWHLWCFFEPAAQAAAVRAVAHSLVPAGAELVAGGVADARAGKGIEIFPKQAALRKNGTGSAVWLPYWHGAPDGANVFYQLDSTDALVPCAQVEITTISADTLARVVSLLPEADSASALPTARRPPAVTPERPRSLSSPDWDDWRERALAALPLESVYGTWLTGRAAGAGWLECRDPSSPTGDANPSSSVADGSSEAERGKFHSFISGVTLSVFDFLVTYGEASDFKEACRQVADLSGVALPQLAAVEDSPVLDDWLAWVKTQDAERNGVSSPPSPPPASHGPEQPATGNGNNGAPRRRRPDIQINDRPLDHIVKDAWQAVLEANVILPAVFRRTTSLVRLLIEGDVGRIEDMNETAVYGLLARVANWVKQNRETFQYTFPVHDVARDLIAYPSKELPMLDGVVSIPVFDQEGTLVSTPGYNASSHLWYQPPRGFQFPAPAARPTEADVAAARSLFFDELLVDFPFDSVASRAHMLAAILLPFARRLISGPTPLHLIHAPQGGSGKGLLVNVIAIVATGYGAIGSSLPENEDEVRKRLTAELGSGKPLIVIDNIDRKRRLYSPALLAASTSWPFWTDRLLGQTKMVSVPNDVVWLLNGNNPQLSDEVARRCVSIRIVPNTPRPWLRTGFRHPNLTSWARERRAELVGAALVLVQNWIVRGRPSAQQILGSFEAWSQIMGGILDAAGVDGFLSNVHALHDTTDSETAMWFDFVGAWWEAYKDCPVRVHQLTELCAHQELLGRVIGEGSERSQAIRLGRALQGARDRVVGDYRIEEAGKDRESKRPMYRLANPDTSSPSTDPKRHGDTNQVLNPHLPGT